MGGGKLAETFQNFAKTPDDDGCITVPQGFGIHHDFARTGEFFKDADGRITRLQRVDDGVGVGAGDCGVDADDGAGHFAAVRLRILEARGNSRQIADAGCDAFHVRGPTGALGVEIAGLIKFERGQETHDLFFADFETAANAVMGRTSDGSVLDERAQRPGFGEDIHILVLKGGGEDEVAAAAEDTGGLRALDVLTAAESDKIRTGRDQ